MALLGTEEEDYYLLKGMKQVYHSTNVRHTSPPPPPPQSCPTSSARNRLANGGAPLTGSGSLILPDVGENRRALRSKWREEQRPQV
jgi:hypothetical protein